MQIAHFASRFAIMQIVRFASRLAKQKDENYHRQLDLQQENIPLKLSARAKAKLQAIGR